MVATVLAIIVGSYGHGHLFLALLIMVIGGTQWTKNGKRLKELRDAKMEALQSLRTHAVLLCLEVDNKTNRDWAVLHGSAKTVRNRNRTIQDLEERISRESR